MKPGKGRFFVLGMFTLQFGATLSNQDSFDEYDGFGKSTSD